MRGFAPRDGRYLMILKPMKSTEPTIIELDIHKLEEAFDHRIVVAIAASTHAGYQVVGFQKGLPFMAAELAPLIRMNGDRLFGLAAPDRHQ